VSAGWAGLNPYFAPYAKWLYQTAEASGFRPQLVSAYRSRAEQQALYDRYLECQEQQRRLGGDPSRCIPAAKPGDSYHEYGLAIDMTQEPPPGWSDDAWDSAGGYRLLGNLWKSLGFRAGSDFNDPNHFDVGPRWRDVFIRLGGS
jgi:peptidoglycan L-alanyl-D-glutamate endopeptidase CwlK